MPALVLLPRGVMSTDIVGNWWTKKNMLYKIISVLIFGSGMKQFSKEFKENFYSNVVYYKSLFFVDSAEFEVWKLFFFPLRLDAKLCLPPSPSRKLFLLYLFIYWWASQTVPLTRVTSARTIFPGDVICWLSIDLRVCISPDTVLEH